MNTNARNVLRKQLRAARRALSPVQQRAAGKLLARQVGNWLPLISKKHIAFYWPNDGEIDPRPLMRCLEKQGKCCYLPRLYADGRHQVWFKRYRTGDRLYNNQFGIPEPAITQPHIPAWALQVVLMPLVGFDKAGNRLGMGGGFYDRSFAFKQKRHSCQPKLIGLAHSIQQVDNLSVQGWDIPVDNIVTELGVSRFINR
jgi:5-formyltetrahydrofolate cyclo-ligase